MSSLILGMIHAYSTGKPIKYEQLAKILNKHPNTVARAVKRLLEKGSLNKRDDGIRGAIYTVEDISYLPQWIVQFTAAIIQIETNADIKEAVYQDCKGLGFRRGLAVLKQEILDKFGLSERVKKINLNPAHHPKPDLRARRMTTS